MCWSAPWSGVAPVSPVAIGQSAEFNPAVEPRGTPPLSALLLVPRLDRVEMSALPSSRRGLGGGGGVGGGDVHVLKRPAVCMKPGDGVRRAVVCPHHCCGDAPPRGGVRHNGVPARLLQQYLPGRQHRM